MPSPFEIQADRDTFAISKRLGAIARASGGKYDSTKKAWVFLTEAAYNEALELQMEISSNGRFVAATVAPVAPVTPVTPAAQATPAARADQTPQDSMGPFYIPADRSTFDIKDQLGKMSRASGGGYDLTKKAWKFLDEASYKEALDLKGKQRTPVAPATPGTSATPASRADQLPEGPTTFSYFDTKRDQMVFAAHNDAMIDALVRTHLAKNDIVATYDEEKKAWLFTSKQKFDQVLGEYSKELRSENRALIEKEIASRDGIGILADEATYPLRDEFKQLGGIYNRIGNGGFWYFANKEAGAGAIERLNEFKAQPPSIDDPNATFVRGALAQMGWFKRDADDPEKGGWVFVDQASLEKANELVSKARLIDPRTVHALNIAITLGAGEESFGFDPKMQPEKAQNLDRYAAGETLKKAKAFLATQEIDLDREIRNDRTNVQRKTPELITGSAARHGGDTRDRPGTVVYRPEADVLAVSDALSSNAGHADDASTKREIGALIKSVEEQLGLTMDSKTLRFHSDADATHNLFIGTVAAQNERYIAVTNEKLEYLIINRDTILGNRLTDLGKTSQLIADKTLLAFGRRGNIYMAVEAKSQFGAGTYEDAAKRLDDATKSISQKGPLSAPLGYPNPRELPESREILVTDLLNTLKKDHQARCKDAEVAHNARIAEAETKGRIYLEPLKMPPSPTEINIVDSTRLIHGFIVGDYGQGKGKGTGQNYLPPASKNYFAVQDKSDPRDIHFFDSRLATDKFKDNMAIRRAYADRANEITVGMAYGDLVVVLGNRKQEELEARHEHWANEPPEPRKAQAIELPIGEYDNVVRLSLTDTQHWARQVIASNLGKDLNQIRTDLIGTGKAHTTEEVFQYAGIGSHIFNPADVRQLRGEFLGFGNNQSLHGAIHMRVRIDAGKSLRKYQDVAVVLAREDFYLQDLHRWPKPGEQIQINVDKTISPPILSCSIYDREQIAAQKANEILGRRSKPSDKVIVDLGSEEIRELHLAQLAVARGVHLILDPEMRSDAQHAEELPPRSLSREGHYEGPIFKYTDEASHKDFLAHLQSDGSIVRHLIGPSEKGGLERSDLETGDWVRVVYRDGQPLVTDHKTHATMQHNKNVQGDDKQRKLKELSLTPEDPSAPTAVEGFSR